MNLKITSRVYLKIIVRSLQKMGVKKNVINYG